MIRTGLVGTGGKIELARLLTRLPKTDLGPLESVPLSTWLDDNTRSPRVRATVETLVRLSTYANAPGLVSTAAALRQLRLASRPGVLYVDGGWQTLVDGLGDLLRERGTRVQTSAAVAEVSAAGHGWRVTLAGGAEWRVDAVVLAIGPRAAASLVTGKGGGTLREWAADCVPARAACLDVGLRSLPMPERTFALGLDAPLYFSVHSVAAKVAPEGQALVHAMKYLAPDDSGSAEDHARELESWLDVCQPGWRRAIVTKRYLPHVVATNDMVRARTNGVRPGPTVPGTPGLLVVGDWVGAEGMLADASFASAETAVRALCDDDAPSGLQATG
jgi:phytoene dehydrogenase-like protein